MPRTSRCSSCSSSRKPSSCCATSWSSPRSFATSITAGSLRHRVPSRRNCGEGRADREPEITARCSAGVAEAGRFRFVAGPVNDLLGVSVEEVGRARSRLAARRSVPELMTGRPPVPYELAERERARRLGPRRPSSRAALHPRALADTMPEATMLEELRPGAFAVAYRKLGSVSEAEDIVQEALLRLHLRLREGERIESPRAYLSTVVTRLCIDQLRSARGPTRELRGRMAARAAGRRRVGTTRPTTPRWRTRCPWRSWCCSRA